MATGAETVPPAQLEAFSLTFHFEISRVSATSLTDGSLLLSMMMGVGAVFSPAVEPQVFSLFFRKMHAGFLLLSKHEIALEQRLDHPRNVDLGM